MSSRDLAVPGSVTHDQGMVDRDNVRVVYSTSTGRVCPGCGWPQRECTCSTKASDVPVPMRPQAKLRMEKKGRGGKTVTVVYDLPRNSEFLKNLCGELKRLCVDGPVLCAA